MFCRMTPTAKYGAFNLDDNRATAPPISASGENDDGINIFRSLRSMRISKAQITEVIMNMAEIEAGRALGNQLFVPFALEHGR